MHVPDASAHLMRQLVAVKRIPLMASLPTAVQAGLAEHARVRNVSAGEVVAWSRDVVRFFPDGVRLSAPTTALGAPSFAPHAPDLLPWLLRIEPQPALESPADALVVEIDALHLSRVLEDEFSLFLVIARAMAAEIVGERASVRLAKALAETATPNLLRVPDERLDLMARVLSLRQTLPFAHDQVGSLVQIARNTVELRADDGMELWREGDASHHAIFALQGGVQARIGGRDAFRLGPGSILGGFDALARRRRWFTAVAEGQLVALALPVESFLDLLEDRHDLAEEVLRALAQALLIACNGELASVA